MIPFLNYGGVNQKYKQEILKKVEEIIDNGQFVAGSGDYIEKLEKEFAKFVGTKYAVMTGAGTHSLYLAYKALGLGSGDSVIVPSHTFIATIDQIIAVGATPVLVDIDEHGLADWEKIRELLFKTEKVKAIVNVHLEGKICTFPDNFNSGIIIEDAAQALGAQGIGKGIMQCYSLFPAKIMGSIGNAGMITTNNKNLAERLRLMRSNSNIGKNPDLDAEWGMNMEPDNIQAAVVSLKMKDLPKMLARRKEIAEAYNLGLQDLPITLPWNQEGRVWQDYVIRTERVLELKLWLDRKGIGTLGVGLIPNHKYKVLGNLTLPNTEKYLATQMRLPCNTVVTDEDQVKVIEAIREFYGT